MASLTLPHPSITFVPLDVLTAEELNEIVDNVNSLAGAFPISGDNIAAGAVGATQLASSAVTSAKIASSAVTSSKIDWSGIASSQTITLGTRKIVWGEYTTSLASGTEVSRTVYFPTTFYSVPEVVGTCGLWVADPRVMIEKITTSSFNVIMRHNQGNAVDFVVRWIAIG